MNKSYAYFIARRDWGLCFVPPSIHGIISAPKMTQQITRVPVVSSSGIPLMPTTCARARRWIEQGKAVGKRNIIGVFYVELLHYPSGFKTQEIVVGVDRGKAFTGIAIQTKLATIALFHLCLPGFYKSKKDKKDRRIKKTGSL